ncbi:hypothetical protein HYQ45_009881 [Verticillium longisporum]|uniref:Uncharacterized protein n=1 Tax=Verticillium longisporum TaxID=100787 RepID=A0A8I2ZKR7_VERLO|nr:hypothetical protein HYQ45_009881 [Verticillium longisporum]
MFIHVFMSRQKSFLAEAQWLHAPFSKSGIAPLQNLFSEMINMPVSVGVVEGLDSMPLEQAQFAAENALHNFETWVRQLVSLREAQGDGVSLLPTISPTFGRFILFAHKTSDKSDTSSPA